MSFYIRIVGQGAADQFWDISDNEAIKLGVENAQGGLGSYYIAEAGETIWEAIGRQTGWLDPNSPATWPFYRLELDPRTYYQRIARPISFSKQKYMRSPSADGDINSVALGVGQLKSLIMRLGSICQTVHPGNDNLRTYGHEIRNLIILASTEVEAHWRGVLRENNIVGRLTTTQYARLIRPMRLNEYAIGFTDYPWLEPFSPFLGWNIHEATRSLEWYDAYNKIKHDREENFRYAQLLHAFNSVVACVVMQIAQFTASYGLGGESDLSARFRLVRVPQWNPSEIYCDFGEEGRMWEAIPHPILAGP